MDAEHVVIHTGQHYDPEMSETFFSELDLPEPVANLMIGSGSGIQQTSRALGLLEKPLEEIGPDWVLVYGDTNSTVAGALAASKLGLRMAHVEAGLRSGSMTMPEEANRIVADHLADVLFAPTQTALTNLQREGLGRRSIFSGDVMADLILEVSENYPSLEGSGDSDGRPYLVATLHRPSNTDDGPRLSRLLTRIGALPVPVHLVAHPRLAQAVSRHQLSRQLKKFVVVPPVTYLSMIRLVKGASGVITDSGGLQKEAFLMGVPCITIRHETEWPETLHGGWNVLSPDGEGLEAMINRPLLPSRPEAFGNGQAALGIARFLASG